MGRAKLLKFLLGQLVSFLENEYNTATNDWPLKSDFKEPLKRSLDLQYQSALRKVAHAQFLHLRVHFYSVRDVHTSSVLRSKISVLKLFRKVSAVGALSEHARKMEQWLNILVQCYDEHLNFRMGNAISEAFAFFSQIKYQVPGVSSQVDRLDACLFFERLLEILGEPSNA